MEFRKNRSENAKGEILPTLQQKCWTIKGSPSKLERVQRKMGTRF
jgi:hypothetical protein